MKKLIIILIAWTTFAGCKKVKEEINKLLRFNINSESNFTIPGNGIVGVLLNVVSPEIESNAEETFSNQGTKAELVKEIKLTKATLTVTAPPGQTLAFIETIRIYLLKGDGSDPVLIAYKENVPSNTGNQLELDTDESLLLDEYIKGDSFRLRTEYKQRSQLTEDTDIRCNLVFNVLVDPI